MVLNKPLKIPHSNLTILDAYIAPIHYLNQFKHIVNWTLGNKLQNLNQNIISFKTSFPKCRPENIGQCVNILQKNPWHNTMETGEIDKCSARDTADYFRLSNVYTRQCVWKAREIFLHGGRNMVAVCGARSFCFVTIGLLHMHGWGVCIANINLVE